MIELFVKKPQGIKSLRHILIYFLPVLVFGVDL